MSIKYYEKSQGIKGLLFRVKEDKELAMPFPLSETKSQFGRDPKMTLRIQNPQVSPLHFDIEFIQEGKALLTNHHPFGTLVNEQTSKIPFSALVKTTQELKGGDLLQIGDICFLFDFEPMTCEAALNKVLTLITM